MNKIEITFPAAVQFPDGFEQTLCALVEMVCKKWQAENPTMVMWTAGIGSKITRMPIMAGDEQMEFDDNVFSIECEARDDYYGENHDNPMRDELRRRSQIERAVRKERAVETLVNGIWVNAEVKPGPFYFDWDQFDYRLPTQGAAP